jgi:hypothetical protein
VNLRYEFKLRRLQRERQRVDHFYAEKLSSARKNPKNGDDVRSLESEASHEWHLATDEIRGLVTEELTSVAERLFVPVPSWKEEKFWSESYIPGEQKFLTTEGVSHLRDLIRDERKKRREARLSQFDLVSKVIVTLTGLIGACIGLVSILKK